MSELPTTDDVSRALEYPSDTDVESGRLKAHTKALEHTAKVIKSLAYLDAVGTVAEREARAYSSSAYRAWIEDYQNALADLETMNAKRKTAELTVDVWRSVNASRRQGNI